MPERLHIIHDLFTLFCDSSLVSRQDSCIFSSFSSDSEHCESTISGGGPASTTQRTQDALDCASLQSSSTSVHHTARLQAPIHLNTGPVESVLRLQKYKTHTNTNHIPSRGEDMAKEAVVREGRRLGGGLAAFDSWV